MEKFNLNTRDEFVFDEKGNTILSLRWESWNGREAKLSLRKCYIDKEGNETPNKGFSFLTEDGPHTLTEELIRRGYGDTNTIVNELKKRDDIGKQLDDVETSEDEYFDPRSLFASGVESDD